MPVSELSPADLDRLAARVADHLAAKLANRRRLVDGIELAEICGVSLATIERHKAAGRIPFVSFGVRVKYDPDAVIAALAQRPATARATER